ncbi:ubiquitin carboxyl-terminal hydrolase 43 isoform X2 [Patagioenas fasciata]|uniref:ubiquitin carboxyl-terminal hydrolase 43 isoform X2 n=1 Tax=Patagioenas fasciata TaxID=372321 RepID=UPI003A991EE1
MPPPTSIAAAGQESKGQANDKEIDGWRQLSAPGSWLWGHRGLGGHSRCAPCLCMSQTPDGAPKALPFSGSRNQPGFLHSPPGPPHPVLPPSTPPGPRAILQGDVPPIAATATHGPSQGSWGVFSLQINLATGGGRRRRALRSLGSLAGRLLRTWARLAGGRGRRRAVPEDDEGGFRGGGGPGERRNHGNSCFMTAVLQCLSNTAPLAEFLALGRYRARGARAEVTHRLAALVRALWTRDCTRSSPRSSSARLSALPARLLQNIVSKHSAQFRGNAQHDALEFLLWLLDRMHEDLGAASPAQHPCVPEEAGKDGIIDASRSPPAAWQPHGQSFVQSHFQAQYRSSLTCPHCLKQSNTFDPFLCISLPIPLRQTRFGPPLVLREERGVSWEQLQQSILAQMRALLRGEVQAQGAGTLFRIRLAGGLATCAYLSPQDPRPLCHPAVDRALQLSQRGGPPHVKLTVEWDMSTKERLFGDIQEEEVQDAESVRLQQQAHRQQHSCTLDECFQLYTKEEQLAPDDAWRCPHCKVLQQGTVKLSLWTLPDILIIHLKRFRQVAEHWHKLTTLVRFPLRGLDMAPHMAQQGQASRQMLRCWVPWQRSPCSPRDYLYDLYAVCNHHGSMQGGHYTAYCCNALDGRWYSYDDSRVEGVQEAEVSTRSAYILFYQRRNAAPSWAAGSSLRGPHWLTRLGTSTGDTAAAGHSATRPLPPGTPDATTALEKGGFEARPLVRGVQGRSLSVKVPPASAPPVAVPPRWSFSSKERGRPGVPGGLVAYLESGSRPRCTRRSLLPLGTGGESDPDTPPTPSPPPGGPIKQPGKGQEEPGTPRAPRQPLRVPTPRRAASAGAEGTPHQPPKNQSSPKQSGEGTGGLHRPRRPQPEGEVDVPPAHLFSSLVAINRSQSSASLPLRPERGLRRSASLGRGVRGSPLPAWGPPGTTLQRGRQPVGSLCRLAVPESSF